MAFTITKNFHVVQSGYIQPRPPAPVGPELYSLYNSTTFYVNSGSGNDVTGDGSSGAPWRTLSGSYSQLRKQLIAPGTPVTLQFADGTYAGWYARDLQYPITLKGNQSFPNNVVFTGYVESHQNSYIRLQYQKVQWVVAYHGGMMEISSGVTINGTVNNHIYCAEGGIVKVTANYSCEGNAGSHVSADAGSVFYDSGLTLTISGTPTWTYNFASASNRGKIRFHRWGGTRLAFSGGANGGRYWTEENSLIDTNGGGVNYLPGNIAGNTNSGGYYL